MPQRLQGGRLPARPGAAHAVIPAGILLKRIAVQLLTRLSWAVCPLVDARPWHVVPSAIPQMAGETVDRVHVA